LKEKSARRYRLHRKIAKNELDPALRTFVLFLFPEEPREQPGRPLAVWPLLFRRMVGPARVAMLVPLALLFGTGAVFPVHDGHYLHTAAKTLRRLALSAVF
jgi:hypothetical protein